MPAKELFNQTLKQDISLTDRFALGVPSLLGCDNITISDFIRATGMTLISRHTGKTTGFSFTPDTESKILSIDFKNTGATDSTVAVSCGDEDLVPATTIAAGTKLENSIFKSYSSQIDIAITGSTCTVVILYIRNPY